MSDTLPNEPQEAVETQDGGAEEEKVTPEKLTESLADATERLAFDKDRLEDLLHKIDDFSAFISGAEELDPNGYLANAATLFKRDAERLMGYHEMTSSFLNRVQQDIVFLLSKGGGIDQERLDALMLTVSQNDDGIKTLTNYIYYVEDNLFAKSSEFLETEAGKGYIRGMMPEREMAVRVIEEQYLGGDKLKAVRRYIALAKRLPELTDTPLFDDLLAIIDSDVVGGVDQLTGSLNDFLDRLYERDPNDPRNFKPMDIDLGDMQAYYDETLDPILLRFKALLGEYDGFEFEEDGTIYQQHKLTEAEAKTPAFKLAKKLPGFAGVRPRNVIEIVARMNSSLPEFAQAFNGDKFDITKIQYFPAEFRLPGENAFVAKMEALAEMVTSKTGGRMADVWAAPWKYMAELEGAGDFDNVV